MRETHIHTERETNRDTHTEKIETEREPFQDRDTHIHTYIHTYNTYIQREKHTQKEIYTVREQR